MASNLPAPLAKLRPYKTKAAADLIRALKAARKDILAQIALAASKASTATNAKEREALFAEIEKRFKALSSGIDAQIRDLTGKAAKAGHADAVAALGDNARVLRYDPARNERYFRMVHPANGRNVAAVFTDQMSETAVNMLRTAFVDVFREGTVSGMTANEMQKALRDRWDSVSNDGNMFRFVDRSGRRWENARYLQMLVETNAQRVAIESSIDTFAQNGVKLAQISDDGDEDCPVCAAWEGRIIQLAGKSKKYPTYEDARAAGVFHPNCTHFPLPVDELLDKEEIERQARVGKPTGVQMEDAGFMQGQKDLLDEQRYIDDGKSPDDARRAVTADRVERAIRSGVFSDAAAAAARMLPPGKLDELRASGIPSFEPARNGENVGSTRGGRVILTPADPSAEDILKLLGVEQGGSEPPAPRPPAPRATPPAFPENPDMLKTLRLLGGSTGAELVEDDHGQRFVRKRGGAAGGEAAEHVRSEAAADEAYRAMGVDVPACRLYEREGKPPVKLSRFIDGAQPLGAYLDAASPAERIRVTSEIQKDFDIDALFGNRDVVGASRDNILIDKDSRPWRIDNGASFGWRAQGARKNDWTRWPDELLTMPKADINKGVLDGVSLAETVIRSTARDYGAVIDVVPQRDRSVFRERIKEMQEMGFRAKSIKETGHIEPYNSSVIEHSYALSKDGFREVVPKAVKAGEYGSFRSSSREPTADPGGPGGMPSDWQTKIVNAAKTVNHHAKDKSAPSATKLAIAEALKPQLKKLAADGAKNAEYWLDAVKAIGKAAKTPGSVVDILDTSATIQVKESKPDAGREYRSLTEQVHEYIKQIGGDVSLVTDWQASQAGHSWDKAACLRKVVQEHARPLDGSQTWVTKDPVKLQYYKDHEKKFRANKAFADQALRTFAAYDAAVQLALENTAFAHRDGDRRVVALIRTENKEVLRDYGITEKDRSRVIAFPRGACESHSVFEPKEVHGTEATLVRVPFPLIKGMYFFERKPGDGKGCFYNDKENEFNCDTRGLRAVYIGTKKDVSLTAYKESAKILSET